MLECMRSFAAVGSTDEIVDTSNHTESTEEVIDLKGDQFEESHHSKSLNLNYMHLWALALTTSIGGHYLTWNDGLIAGFGTYTVACVIIASGYICLLLTLAELSSAIPFAGGAYGIARVTLGIFPGFLVACLDSFKSVLYVSTAAGSIGRMITYAFNGDEHYEPLYWLAFYVVSVSLHSYGGRTLWRVIVGMAVTSVLLLVVYVLGSAKFANLEANAPLNPDTNSPYEQWFHGGMYEFMHILSTPCWFFVGIQNINLATNDLLRPKSDVPKGYMAALCTVLCTSFSVVLIACSLSPGVPVLLTRINPLTRGYMHMFAITRPHATFISLPAVIGSGFGFMYFSGQQLRAMGLSKLLNPVCAREMPGRSTPVGALVIGSIIGYAICLLIFFQPVVRQHTYDISMMGAFATYLSIFWSFWNFRNHFPTITREFVSPLGLAGAAYGFVVFLLAFISICGFQKNQVAVITFVVSSLLFTVYYFTVVRGRQVFSEEEKTVLFKAYLVKGNAAKAQRLRRGLTKSPQSQSGGATATASSHSAATGSALQSSVDAGIRSRADGTEVSVTRSWTVDRAQGMERGCTTLATADEEAGWLPVRDAGQGDDTDLGDSRVLTSQVNAGVCAGVSTREGDIELGGR